MRRKRRFRTDAVFEEGTDDVSVSAQERVQSECPNCGSVLGYLAVGAATGDSMDCPDCGAYDEGPAGETIRLEEVFDDSHPDVEGSAQEHVQLEYPDCGAVAGYLGVAAAVGSEDVQGFY